MTPATSTTFHHDFSQGGGPSHSTVLSMTSYSVHGTSSMHHHQGSLLFAPPDEDYFYVDPSSAVLPSSEVLLDGSWEAAPCESEVWGYLGADPVEVVYDSMSAMEDELSPIFSDMGQEWIEATMAGLGVSPLDDEQHQPPPSPVATQAEQHPVDSFHQPLDNSPIEGFDVAAAANLDVMKVMMDLEMFGLGDEGEVKFKVKLRW